jgi:hypothetical protein
MRKRVGGGYVCGHTHQRLQCSQNHSMSGSGLLDRFGHGSPAITFLTIASSESVTIDAAHVAMLTDRIVAMQSIGPVVLTW